MNIETAKRLCKINNDFYLNQGDSFSETRKAPWSGWGRCLDILKDEWAEDDGFGEPCRLSVFDLACGNLRFEAFLKFTLPDTELTCYAIDNCDDLVASSVVDKQEDSRSFLVQYQNLDVLGELLDDRYINDHLEAPLCDLSVSFGFMHHVPSRELRREMLLSLINQTRSGGYVIVSCWQFLNNAAMALKAQNTHNQALVDLGLTALDEGDYMLGWKNIPQAYRYCHSFSETEIDQLVRSVANRTTMVARFVSDGRTNNLNTYLLFKVL